MKKRSERLVITPLRFVEAIFDFTPVQRDLIMLIQHQTHPRAKIKSEFSIDLKPYLEQKGLQLKDQRFGHYKELCDSMLETKVSFKYFKGNKIYSSYGLFKRCELDRDFIMYVEIIDDVLPLFYINQLKEGHFKENRLVKDLFQQSREAHDNYVAYPPTTYIDFSESSTKRLYEKLLQHRKKTTHKFELSKDELYMLLGYGRLEKVENEKNNLFNFETQRFVQTSYIGVNGWKNLRKQLNTWLKEISEHEASGIKILTKGKNYFSTQGRPIRSVFINVEYKNFTKLNTQQQNIFDQLDEFKLSEKQKFNIINDFPLDKIMPRILQYIIRMRDQNGMYWGERQRGDHRRIQNVPGYIYGVVFGYGNNTNGKQTTP
ncbi:replication initiation protein (plasmid) [Aquimarina sp. TRL1]|uniref:replication initiation protein n=1 Tax=Aquimarina sp. (strain TRL1) TaxID=2736252 RepID=UPI001589EF35|nr:RepB family plasmid replication initiator protein [Aquimarina sp. TRL1]QKX07702.1 replication initiation protein [Aquimarina sp. TRL1]